MGCDPIGGMGDVEGGRRPVISGSGGGKRVRILSTMLTRFSGRTSDSGGCDVLMKAGTVAQQSDVKVFSLTAMQDGRFAMADLRLRAGASGRAPCAIWLLPSASGYPGPTSRGGPSTWITVASRDNKFFAREAGRLRHCCDHGKGSETSGRCACAESCSSAPGETESACRGNCRQWRHGAQNNR